MKAFQQIKETLNVVFHYVGNEKLKKNLLNALPFWIGAFISGAVAVLYAKLFSMAESASRYMLHYSNPYWFLLVAPVCFVLAWWLVHRYAEFAKGSGIPQVTAALELSTPKTYAKVNKLLSLKVIVVKIASSLFMGLGGGVVGREGPMIQISASIFKKINDFLPSWYPKISKRNMIITGAAAGLASAFNTPLGGIVFAIEELTKTHLNYFKSALLTGVIIAGLTALYFLGPYLFLGYPDLDNLTAYSILTIIPLAITTGLVGNFTAQAIMWVLKKKKIFRKNHQKLIYVALCGLLIAVAAIFLGSENIGSGKELMHTTLFTSQKELPWYTPIVRLFGSILSFTTGAAGGIFAPALSSGASIGALFAEWFDLSDSESNLIILCGMVGFLTSISSSPFTSSIIVLEMTDSHNIIFYIMLTALIAYLVSKLTGRKSLYDELKSYYLDEMNNKPDKQKT